jgi:ribosome-binding factor A
MSKFNRVARVNEQLKQEVSLLVRDEVRDPRVGLTTITAVQASPELDHAKVFFTAMGTDEEQQEALTGLRSAAPFIRSQLSRRLHMRRVPELHFELDRVLKEAQRIEELLREALPRTAPDVDVDIGSDDAGGDDE